MKPSPPFYIQITDANGVVVRTRQGGKHEADLKALLKKEIIKLGVGFGRTEAHVEKDIDDGIENAIASLRVQDPINVEPSN